MSRLERDIWKMAGKGWGAETKRNGAGVGVRGVSLPRALWHLLTVRRPDAYVHVLQAPPPRCGSLAASERMEVIMGVLLDAPATWPQLQGRVGATTGDMNRLRDLKFIRQRGYHPVSGYPLWELSEVGRGWMRPAPSTSLTSAGVGQRPGKAGSLPPATDAPKGGAVGPAAPPASFPTDEYRPRRFHQRLLRRVLHKLGLPYIGDIRDIGGGS